MRRSDIILLLALALSALWRWGATVDAPTILPDEWPYVQAARHLQAGGSPYAEPLYLYPPPIAGFIQLASARLGEVGALQVLRSASLVGLVIVVALALRLVVWPWFVRLSVGVLFISLAPAAGLASSLGNVAGLASGLVLIGLVSWEQRPVVAGLATGLGLAIKPVAPLAPLLLAAHRPLAARRQHWVAAAACAVAGIGACAGGLRFLPELLTNADRPSSPYNFSLQRVLAGLGFETSALLIMLVVGGVSLLAVRRHPVGQQDLLNLTVVASLVALPILWSHSLLLLLPAQLLAIDRAAAALIAWGSQSPRRRIEVMLATLAVASTLLSGAVGNTTGLPHWAGELARIVPLVSIPYLGWFVIAPTAAPSMRNGLLD